MGTNLVIIPTYNEVQNVELIVEALFFLTIPLDILIVDDSSPDGTANAVRKLQQKFRQLHLLERKKKDGLGKAYLAGFQWALKKPYDYIFEMDADFSHNPADVIRLLTSSKEKKSISIGSRYISGLNVVNWSWFRLILSYSASKYVQLLTGMPIKDPTSGFICYPREALEEIALEKVKFKGYAFQIEMKYRAFVKNIPLEEISIVFTDRVRGVSKMNSSIIGEAIYGVVWLKIKQGLKQLG